MNVPKPHHLRILLVDDHTNREVGLILGLSENTVRNYLSRVFEKTGLRRRSELVLAYVGGLQLGGGPGHPCR